MDTYLGLESNFDTNETIENGNPLIAVRGNIYDDSDVHTISPDNGLILGISSFFAIARNYIEFPYDSNKIKKFIDDNFELLNTPNKIRFPYVFHTNYGTQVEYYSDQFYRFIINKIKTIYRLKNTEYVLVEINIKLRLFTGSCFIIGKIYPNFMPGPYN